MRRRFYSIKRNNYSVIYYTTSDQLVVTPTVGVYFGANILSNNYIDGIGIITFDNEISTIGNSAFRGYSSLTSVTIPDSVTEIGRSAFEGCSSLTTVTIPDSVTKIEGRAFSGCSSLTTITIPDSVTEIGRSAFEYCSNLASVYCKPTTPPTGYYYMFNKNAADHKIYVPYQSLNDYKTAEYWSDYAYAIVGYDFENNTVV